jgi:hypothetical protein
MAGFGVRKILRLPACLAILIAVSTALGVGCGNEPKKEKEEAEMSIDDAIRVMDAHVKELMAIPGVAGVAVGALDDGRPCIQVLVVKMSSDLLDRIPKEIEGYPVDIQETGEIRAMPGDSNR